MSDSETSDQYATPPRSPQTTVKQAFAFPTDIDPDDASTPALSPEYVGTALWQWAKDVFQDDAHIIFGQVCERLSIPSHVAKRIRRRSMPAVPTLRSILKHEGKPPEDVNAPAPRPRANTFSAPSQSLMDEPVIELPIHSNRASAHLAAPSSTGAISPDLVRPAAQYDTSQPPCVLALMQYTEAAALTPDRSMQSPAVDRRQHGPYAASHTASPVCNNGRNSMHEDDTSLLMSVIDRGLVRAERLEPDQCQQVLAAQQRARFHGHDRGRVWQTGSQPNSTSNAQSEHRTDPRTHVQPLARSSHSFKEHCCASPHPQDGIRPMRQPNQGYKTHQDSRPWSEHRPTPEHGQQGRSMHTYNVHSTSSTQTSGISSTLAHPSVDALVPPPLQPRPPVQRRRLPADSHPVDERHVRWFEDQTRAQRAIEANEKQDMHYAGLIEEHRKAKQMQLHRERERDAQQALADTMMRRGSMQYFFRKQMRLLQSRATP